MPKFDTALPVNTEAGDSFITRIMDALKATKAVDENAALATGLSRGKCVMWSPTNLRWESASGATTVGMTDVIGIVEFVDVGGTTGTVRVSGVFTDSSLAANTAFYCQADGSLGSGQTPLYLGRTTEAGQLCMPSLGGGSSSSGGVPIPAAFLRWDPFGNEDTAITVTDELHTIDASADHVVVLNELPLKESPSSLTARIRDTLQVARSNTATKLYVRNSSWFAVNNVCTIENEKILVGTVEAEADATTLTTTNSSTSSTTYAVPEGIDFATNQIIRMDAELMRVVTYASTTLTVARGYNGTTPTGHTAGTHIYILNTLTVTRGYDSTVAATHAADTPVFIENSLTEVGATPAAGEFWADYSTGAMSFANWNTGKVKHNSADAGKVVAYRYKGIGRTTDGRPGDFVATFAPTPPPRTLKANGAAVSRWTYSDLDTAIYCGDTNNATASWGYHATTDVNPTSNRSVTGQYLVLPDARGEFFRGWADGRSVDTGRVLWDAQAEMIGPHTHTVPAYLGGGGGTVGGGGGETTTPVTTNNNTGTENRPRNLAALICIRY